MNGAAPKENFGRFFKEILEKLEGFFSFVRCFLHIFVDKVVKFMRLGFLK